MNHLRFLPLLWILNVSHAAEVRTWTDLQDRKIEATLLRIEGTSVVIKRQDGREIPFPLAKLCEADQRYVEENRALIPESKGLITPATVTKPEAPAGTLNFGNPWPDNTKFAEDPEITTVEENATTKSFIYESANYRYICDVRLTKTVVKGFAVMFEATHLYCRTLPLAFDGGTKVDGKFKIQLFEKFEDYVKAGGPSNSAGVFIGSKGGVLVPLKSLGVKPMGSSYMFDRDKSSNVIPHELTHQLTPDCYFEEGAMGWFSEGIAEYVAITPYRTGTFNVRGNQKPIMDYVTSFGAKNMGGRALGKKINMPPLKAFMLQTYEHFKETAQLSYGSGLLLTNYFLHMDGDGDAKRTKAFLKALRDGKKGQDALDVLLDGRTYEQLQKEFTKAYDSKGIDFAFE
jgi:SLA1 homology domain 1, SHD1